MKLPRSMNQRVSTFMRKAAPGSGAGRTNMTAPPKTIGRAGIASSGVTNPLVLTGSNEGEVVLEAGDGYSQFSFNGQPEGGGGSGSIWGTVDPYETTFSASAIGALGDGLSLIFTQSATVGRFVVSTNSGEALFIVWKEPGDPANLGFFDVANTNGGAPKQTVTGSKGGNAALASLLSALAAYGLIVDSTT